MAQDGLRREYMPEIKIKVRDKCAEGEGVIICNNNRTVDGNNFPLRGRHCICEFGGLFLS